MYTHPASNTVPMYLVLSYSTLLQRAGGVILGTPGTRLEVHSLYTESFPTLPYLFYYTHAIVTEEDHKLHARQ